jgi:hypothetical protein
VPHLQPDLAQFKGGISGLNAAVRYSPGLIDGVSGSLAIDNGSLFDLEIRNAPVTAARGRLGSPAKIAFALTRDSATAAISASAFELHADTKAAGRITLEGSVDTAARLIHTSEPAPVLEALERTAVAAAPHYRLALGLIGSPPAADWRIAARQSSSDPFLRFSGDRVELRGVFEAGSFQTGDVAADLIERDRGLLIDASLPLAVEGREALFVIPVQLALREPFPEADRKAELLWDPPAVEKIWADFQPRHARAGAFLDRSSIEFGGVSLLQLLAPSEPLRVVVGIGDRLQFHAPVASRLLFGSAAAVSQAEVAWNSGTPSITARIGGGFRNLQSGAFGLASSGVHYAFLEDSFDGSFRLAANDIAVTPETLERWRLDPVSFDQFNRLDVSLQASRSKEQAGPGIVQLAFDTRLRFLNEILQQASDKIRFTVPPQLMTYRGLRASFDANQGVVQTKSPLLELSGVKVLSSELLDVNGEVRIRLGDRLGNEMPLSHLIRFAIGVVR